MTSHVGIARSLSEAEVLRAAELAAVWPSWARPLAVLRAVDPEAPWAALVALPLGLRERRILEVHASTFGPSLEGLARCRACGERASLSLDAGELLAEPSPVEGEFTMDAEGRSFRCRLVCTADLAAETIETIAAHCPRVFAVKEATGNVLRAQAILARLQGRITVLSGDDALTLPMMACGARGVISVTSNVLPGEVQAVCAAFLKGDLETARARHLELLPVHDAMFVETNPGPVKALLAAQGRLAPEVRLPLAWPSEANVAKSQEALSRYLARTVTR